MVADKSQNIGLVIPTLNAGSSWRACLEALKAQTLQLHRVLVVDSASTDKTPVLAREAGIEVISIARADFNHGGTRQWAVEYLADCEIIIFLTQDAILASVSSLERLVNCFSDNSVAVAYGRQLPHAGAGPLEAHARLFNYGLQTITKDSAAVERLGSKVFFCSNSFAAYRTRVFTSLGGFNGNLILGEDMEFAARAIRAGFSNVYCAEATVFHSHDYSLLQTLERYFDLGVFERRNSWMRAYFGSHKGEGLRFIKSELGYLAKNAPSQIPRSLCQTATKLIGYQLGRAEQSLPVALKRKLSMLPAYFRQ